jgi:uncharacterized membrane protein
LAILYLIVSIALLTVFAMLYRVAARGGCELRSVNLWMNVGATGILVVDYFVTGPNYDQTAASLGAVSGILTYVATLAFFYHMRSGRLAVSWTVVGLAVAFPVAASVLLWHEHPSPKQWAGLGLLVVAFVLFGVGRRPAEK